jgi:hypothetical protein
MPEQKKSAQSVKFYFFKKFHITFAKKTLVSFASGTSNNFGQVSKNYLLYVIRGGFLLQKRQA